MKMLFANQRDYKNGYKKHLIAYKDLKKNNNSVISRCLLLVYAVECGLKYLLLEKWDVDSSGGILKNGRDERYGELKTHNLQRLLRALGQDRYQFPKIKTVHGGDVNIEIYHQMLRYGIEVRKKDKMDMGLYENELLKVVDWIEEVI